MTCNCGRPTTGAWLCDRCKTTLAIAIANIAAYYTDLETVQTKRTRYGTQGATKGGIGKAQPLPIDTRFADTTGRGTQVRWDAWNTLVAWCRTVMEDQPQIAGAVCQLTADTGCLHVSCATIRRRRWPANNVPAMCRYLDRQFRWIVLERWAPDILDQLTNLENRLAKLIDRPADKWYAGKCSVPDEEGADCPTELYAQVDRGWIDCPTCGIRHDVAERRDALLREAKDYLVTATEAAGALIAWTDYDGSEDKLVDRIRKWRDRRQITSHGHVEQYGKNRDLYRLGDIQDRLVADAQHAQTTRLNGAS